MRSVPGVARKYPWVRNLSEWSKDVIKEYSSIYKFDLGLFFLQGTKFGPSNLNIQLSNHLTEYDIFLKSLQRHVKVLSSKDRTTKCCFKWSQMSPLAKQKYQSFFIACTYYLCWEQEEEKSKYNIMYFHYKWYWLDYVFLLPFVLRTKNKNRITWPDQSPTYPIIKYLFENVFFYQK